MDLVNKLANTALIVFCEYQLCKRFRSHDIEEICFQPHKLAHRLVSIVTVGLNLKLNFWEQLKI